MYLERVRAAAREAEINVWVSLTQQDPLGSCHVRVNDAEWILITDIPDSRETYLVAMHEIGHAVDPFGWQGLRLDREVRAWLWAVERIGDLTLEDRCFILARLESYAADRRYRRTPVFEDFVDRLKKESPEEEGSQG